MATTISQKLRITERMFLLALHAPANFREQLEPLPEEVNISSEGKSFDQVHWFVTNKAQLDNETDKILKMVKGNVVCWIYYPKGTSKIQTDLTRDKGWDQLLSHTEMQWISLISFNETWSAFGFRLKNASDKKREEKPKVREIFDYVDAVSKTVRLPQDLTVKLSPNKKAFDYFNSLSFTNKKEYIEWIVTAKRSETRAERIEGTIEKLLKGWKNPRNT